VLATAVVAVGIVAAMQVMSFFTPAYIMPPPRAILSATVGILGEDLRHVGITLLRWLAGVVVALVAGSAVGSRPTSARPSSSTPAFPRCLGCSWPSCGSSPPRSGSSSFSSSSSCPSTL
jgi:hypothetical protein